MIALGDDLRADDEIDLVRLDAGDQIGGGGRPLQRIGRGDDGASVGSSAPVPRPAARRRGRTRPGCPARGRPGTHSAGAWRSRSNGIAAVRQTMLDQPCGAGRTADAMAARPAQGQRRIAAAIEEQQRLLPAASVSTSARRNRAKRTRLRRGSRGAGRSPRPAAGPAACAVGQRQLHIAPGACVDHRLQRRRRRDEDGRDLAQPGAHDGHVAAW